MNMAQERDTQHALIIPWGHFAQEIGLISGIEAVKLRQKVCEHTPQAKVIEFLVAILSGAKYLQDISHAAHPRSIMPVIRYPARRPKHWYWRLKSAVDNVPNSARIYCKSGLKTLSKAANLPRNGYPASRWYWQRRNRPK
jgi:hypothetical protein